MSLPQSKPQRTLPLRAMLADLLTLFRFVVALVIVWLGWTQGAAALPAVVLIASAGWISDGIDGAMARSSRVPTRFSQLDYPVDVVLAWSMFLFLGLAGYLSFTLIAFYSLLAAAVFLWMRRKAVLVLFMRGVDVMVGLTALRFAFLYSLPLIAWMLGLGYVFRRRLRRGVGRWLRELASLRSPASLTETPAPGNEGEQFASKP